MAHQPAKVINQSLLKTFKLTFDHTDGEFLLPVSTKTADYSVLLTDSGRIFTTFGATAAVNFTLPSTIKKGVFFIFVNSVDQNMTITAGTADTLITFNDTQADSVAASTTSEKIGAMVLVFCDGNAYHANVISNGTTQTVAT